MIKRILQDKIKEAINNFPVVGILGARQVGKTTLAKEIQKSYKQSVYIDLELPSDFNRLENAELFLRTLEDKLVIIDEVQRKPELFPLLRALVDQNRKPGRFIILGSSSPDLIKNASDSLAGRINYFELTPFLFEEISKSNKINFDEATQFKHWLRGGFPDSFLAGNNELSFSWRQEFINTFLERDIPNFGIRIPAVQLRRFWTMIAHSHGSIWNASKIAASLGVTFPTTKHYLDILEDTFIIRQLYPYYANVKKRLVKSPKVFLRDPGLLHSILNIESKEDLLGNPIAGHSWEGYIIEQIVNMLPKNYNAYYYRTIAGAEIDLVVTEAERPIYCFEIKFSLTPKLNKSFWNAFEDLKCEKAFVVYPGETSYPINEKVMAIPLPEISNIL